MDPDERIERRDPPLTFPLGGPSTDRDSVDASVPVLKRLDAWWTVVLIDPVAVRLVARVEHRLAVTPMRLTVAAHLLGVVSALAFARGHLVLAAVLFEIRFVLDCADGKLARVRGSSSLAGGFLDYVGDYIVVGANVVGMSLYLVWGGHLAVGAAVSLPAAYLAHIAADQARSKQADALGVEPRLTADKLPGGYRGWMADRRMRALPGRIDAEHGLLFVLPLAAGLAGEPRVLVWGAWLGIVYFFYKVLRLTQGGYQLAGERDRA